MMSIIIITLNPLMVFFFGILATEATFFSSVIQAPPWGILALYNLLQANVTGLGRFSGDR
ncbi:MAG: hypothetical protein RBG13Loki_2425 [Promethearchaeota archaeon CR_4]|nr:MAG: hypothetical protein RBG13Loki_2425 [Candidatus Lokiarchaeota archaeon CR_4]